MPNTHSYPTLSDGLAAIIRTFEPTRSTGMIMTRRNVATFIEGLQAMLDEARHLETIADRAQWNEKARREALKDRRAEIAQAVANGHVLVLPIAPRPTAVDRNEGGAA